VDLSLGQLLPSSVIEMDSITGSCIQVDNNPIEGVTRRIVFEPGMKNGLRGERANIGGVTFEKNMFVNNILLDPLNISNEKTTATIVLEFSSTTYSLIPKKININNTLCHAIKNMQLIMDAERLHFDSFLETFFKSWGTHYIESCSFGGAILFEFILPSTIQIDFKKVASDIEAGLIEGNWDQINHYLEYFPRWKMETFGGKQKILHNSPHVTALYKTNFEEWIESVKMKPKCLPTSYIFRELNVLFPVTRFPMDSITVDKLPEDVSVNEQQQLKKNMQLNELFTASVQRRLKGRQSCVIM